MVRIVQPTSTSGGVTTLNGLTGDIILAAGSNITITPIGNTLTIASTSSGSVTSVSGTANRITSTGGTTPVIDISAAYVGQASITTLGTITTGVWNGTAIAAANGGTGITSYTVGDLLYASGASTLSKLADVATGNALISGGVGVAPSWGKINLTTTVSGVLPVANGGTGQGSFTLGSVIFASTGGTLFEDNSNFFWDNTNKRLILGATAASTRFTVTEQSTFQTPVSGSTAQFVGTDANPLRITFDTHNNVSGSGTAFMVRRSRGTAATPLAVQSADVLASYNGRGYGTSQYAAGSTGLVAMVATENFTNTANGTALTFSTTPNGSVTAAEALRIDQNGRIGVGTITPTSIIDATTNGLGVTQTTTSGLALVNTTAAAAAAQQISPAIRWSGKGWGTTAGTSQAVDFREYVLPVQGTANPTGTLVWESAINGASYTQLAAMTSSGQLGIGTIAPAASAILDLTSTTKGMLIPRMTTTQRNAISSPSNGLMIYNTTTFSFDTYNATATNWFSVGYGGAGVADSIAIGVGALVNQGATGGHNIAIGNGNLGGITIGQYNIAIGPGTMTVGNFTSNISIGAFALNNPGTGGANTAVGHAALASTTGTNNTGFGYTAGQFNTTASNQIFINSISRINYSGDQNGSPIYIQQNATVTSQLVTFNGKIGINTIAPAKALDVTGDIQMNTAGNGLYVKQGTNATAGVATLVGGTVVVNTTKVTANTGIVLTGQGGTITNLGSYSVTARTAGTSFTITSSNVLDTNTVFWFFVEAA